MKKSANVVLQPWLDSYRPPNDLKHAQARLWYALKELKHGSTHRALDVLLTGATMLPMYIKSDRTNFKYVPPSGGKPVLPHTLKAADLKIRSIIRTIEQGGVRDAIKQLQRE